MPYHNQYLPIWSPGHPKARNDGGPLSNQDFNQYLAATISILKLRGEVVRPLLNVKEETGRWHDLLERRKHDKALYDGLFFDLETGRPPLTPENRKEIETLKRTFYPLLLCDLYKCYERTGRFRDAENVLLEARALGCRGAELLLFSLYAEHVYEMVERATDAMKLLRVSFQRAKEIDVFSETVAKEINNAYFHAAALTMFAVGYLMFDDDADGAFDCFRKILRFSLPDGVPEQLETLMCVLQFDPPLS